MHFAEAKVSFNSTLVQLKANNQKTAINSPRRFNSTLVQLKGFSRRK